MLIDIELTYQTIRIIYPTQHVVEQNVIIPVEGVTMI